MLQAISYEAGGVQLTGYLADGSLGAPAAGVLVAHEAMGINDHVKGRAEQLAQLGYVAFALDLYGAADLDLPQAQAKSAEVMRTPGLLLTRAYAALDVLSSAANVSSERLAAIGFCQGGSTVLELARSGAPLRAVVGFHPGFHRPAGSADGPITAKVLMISGGADPVVTDEDRANFMAEMRAANADWQLHVLGGVGHSFTNPRIDEFGYPGFSYDAAADRRSWRLMSNLLDEVFAA